MGQEESIFCFELLYVSTVSFSIFALTGIDTVLEWLQLFFNYNVSLFVQTIWKSSKRKTRSLSIYIEESNIVQLLGALFGIF